MHMNIFLQKTSNLFTENRLLKFVIVILALAVAVNSFLVARAVKYQRVILIPPKLTGTVEFVQGKPSDRYIRDMGRRITSLAATYSPATARAQFDELLALYAPEAYPEAEKTWYTLASRIEETRVSNVFYPQNLTLDAAGGRLTITGERKQFADDRLVDSADKTYIAHYRIEDGRFYLLSFLEKWQEDDSMRKGSEKTDG
jgi:conjugal transfer pilus assembly protein TraE